MTRNFFKGSTDFGLMLLVNEISQWLEKNVAESTGRKTLQESIPPHRLPVLASFLGCITVILKPDNPTFERMQKKELKALYPFLYCRNFLADTFADLFLGINNGQSGLHS